MGRPMGTWHSSASLLRLCSCWRGVPSITIFQFWVLPFAEFRWSCPCVLKRMLFVLVPAYCHWGTWVCCIGYCSKGMQISPWLYFSSKAIHFFLLFLGNISKRKSTSPRLTIQPQLGAGPWISVADMCLLVMMRSMGRTTVLLLAGATWLIISVNSDLHSPPQSLTELHLTTFPNECTQDLRTVSWLTLGKWLGRWAYECPGVVRVLSTQRVSWGLKGVLGQPGIMFSDTQVSRHWLLLSKLKRIPQA